MGSKYGKKDYNDSVGRSVHCGCDFTCITLQAGEIMLVLVSCVGLREVAALNIL
jgi:hypothetical protein